MLAKLYLIKTGDTKQILCIVKEQLEKGDEGINFLMFFSINKHITAIRLMLENRTLDKE